MSTTPGPQAPGAETRESDALTGVVDSTGTNTSLLGGVAGDKARLKEVRVESDSQNFDFNVEWAGNDVFSSEQSPSSGEEKFTPDQNTYVGENGALARVDVSSTGGDSTVEVTAVVEHSGA